MPVGLVIFNFTSPFASGFTTFAACHEPLNIGAPAATLFFQLNPSQLKSPTGPVVEEAGKSAAIAGTAEPEMSSDAAAIVVAKTFNGFMGSRFLVTLRTVISFLLGMEHN